MARPCACRRAAGSTDDFIRAARIPPRYEEAAFSNFDAFTPSLRQALETCLRYCTGYPYLGSTDEGLGLLFTGDNGVGKTHLAVSVLRELSEQKKARGQFWDFHDLIRVIRSSYNPDLKTSELQVLEPVINSDVLLLDDLGAWKITDWVNDTLFYILNSRYTAKRATLITTNFQDIDRDAMERMERDAEKGGRFFTKEFLLERIGMGARSRLMEMCLVVKVQGTDYRQARQTSNQAAILGYRRPEQP